MLEFAETIKVAALESLTTMYLIGIFSENCRFYVLQMDVGTDSLYFRPYCFVTGPHDLVCQLPFVFQSLSKVSADTVYGRLV